MDFEKDKYKVVRKLVPKNVVDKLYIYAKSVSQKQVRDPESGERPGFYGDALMETLLVELTPRIQDLTGLQLDPTFSYFRVYRHGDVLKRHLDRTSCEISVTLTIGVDGKRWPIFVRNPEGKESSILLAPGDGLLYRGCECEHWREIFEGERQAQLSLHYVDQQGPYSDYRYDKRPKLVISPFRFLGQASHRSSLSDISKQCPINAVSCLLGSRLPSGRVL